MAEGFTGTGVALVTPFHSDKSIDFNSLEKIVHHVIDGGVDYIVALGTTGESVTLSKKEKNEVVKSIQKYNNKVVPVVMGLGGNNTYEVVNTIQSTDFDEIAAILSVVPYYNKPTQKGLYEHFSAIAKACPIPVILYNVPGRTASNLNADTVIRLATDNKNIIAVKEASGDFNQIKQIINESPEHFQVISGDDVATLQMIKEGGSGVISVLANSHPLMFSELVKKALNKDFDGANILHNKLLEYYDVLFEEGNPAGIKSAVEILGLCSRDVRLPLVSASAELVAKMKNTIEQID